MPLYEYQCAQCGERIEIIQKFSDPSYRHCPKCGGEMRKLISSPAIQFKGSGFYKTDYASKKPESSSETKSEPKSESKTDGKSTSTEKTS
jgi:putative FmdB family regulatory protein